MVLLLLLAARSGRTGKTDQKCPEKQEKKSKRDMNIMLIDFLSETQTIPSKAIAVFDVAFLAWTNTITWWPFRTKFKTFS